MLLHMRSTVDFCQSMQYFVSSNCLPQCDATTFYDVPAYVSLLDLIVGVVVIIEVVVSLILVAVVVIGSR